MGAVTATGLGVDSLWTAARDGRSGVSHFQLDRYPKQRITRAAHVKDFPAEALLGATAVKTCDRFAQFALVASREALAQAGYDEDARLGHRCGAIIGSGIGGSETTGPTFSDLIALKTRPRAVKIPLRAL